MSRKKKTLIGLGVVLILGAIVYANLRFKRSEGVTVNAEAVQKRRLESIVSASGKVQPKRSVNISADTSGRVTELAVNEGDRVKQGQFLLQIDPRNLRTRVESGQASLEAARSTAQQLRLRLEGAKAALKQAEDNHRRQVELSKGGLTTREQLERAENELRIRQSELRTQQQEVETQKLRMEQERATLDSARYDLHKVRIESPIDGIVTRRNIEAGETAIIGTMNNPGTVLLTIADMSVIETEIDVDETDIPSVHLGQSAKVTIDALPARTFTAKVTEIGNSPVQVTGQTATQATNFKVVLTIDGEIPEVRPGFTCTAEITTAVRENAVAVPIQALAVRELTFDDKGQIVRQKKDERRGRSAIPSASAQELPKGHSRKEEEGVFVVRGTTVEFVPVKTGIAGDKYFEVLSGLKDGDQVVTGPFNSVRNLADGDAIKVAPVTPARRP
ncbi:MAG TPA: efflux RND transporter periplasmic adaptor subunit [Vicinamibacterales bacterium]|nr:efflux RND transporter periplasmic adaptor subunit [Vicinamibacterales bacterium]